MHMSTARSAPVLASLLLALGCGAKVDRPHGSLGDSDSDTDADSGSDSASDSDTTLLPPALSISGVVPDHGPTAGGNEVEIRGDGFGGAFFLDYITITIGGRSVLLPDFEITSPRNLRVLVMPPGEVGPADVEVATNFPGEPAQVAILPAGYTYDSFYVDPPRGSVGGGTRVSLYGSGTRWDASARVTFDAAAATDCTVLGATRIDCRTPPGAEGDADVRVEDASGELHYADEVEDAYAYYNAADPIGGGLGGGPLDGQMNVTVLNDFSRRPVVGAFVMVGTDADTLHQGLTNALGQIVFEGDDLVGRHQVSAGAEGYDSGGFVAFDARDVTIFLRPLPDPGNPRPGIIRMPSTIQGELIFDGPAEFGPNPWLIVPDPVGPDEIKRCEVATTQADVFRPNFSAGSDRVVTEDEINPDGDGYPYQIASRAAALSVWAICGIYDEKTFQFLPYAMGVTRDVFVGPEEVVVDIDIRIDIPLDHLTVAELADAPLRAESGPDHYRVDIYLDLGGEGVVARDDRSLSAIHPFGDFRFVAQPPLIGTIDDAQWTFMAGAYSGEGDTVPLSAVLLKGVLDTIDPVVLDDFLGVPVLEDPEYGGTVVDGRISWTADGAIPTFNAVTIDKPGLVPTPIWRVFSNGEVTEIVLPDLPAIGGIPEPPSGPVIARIDALRTPVAPFDDFSYLYLRQSYWQAWAQDVVTVELP